MAITVTFGTVEYKEGGIVEIPVTFSESVIAPSKTVFSIIRVSGDDLDGVEYQLFKLGAEYRVAVSLPPNRKGSFKITTRGSVLKADNSWDTLTEVELTVNYDTSVPKLKNYDIPADYTAGGIFDVLLEYDVDCTLADPTEEYGADATYLDFFIFEGANLGVPNFYRKTDNMFPTPPLPAELPADWTQDDLQTADARIYLLRWYPVERATGIFNMTIKPGFVRGPVS